jgi:hypothetical protein
MVWFNKYAKWYFAIVDRAKTRVLDGYQEKHHVLPQSMGGSDASDNIVSLTAREHFICHLLLTKITHGKDLAKMRKAIRYMTCAPKKMQGLRYIPNSRIFEIARKEAALANRGNSEISEKISKSMTGRSLTKEHRAKISEGLKGTIKTAEAAKKCGDAQRGKPKKESSKQKMVEAWVERRKRKEDGLEHRSSYSEKALANIRAGAIRRVENQRMVVLEFAFGVW